ncbi:UDP-N-acetylmuramate dehydrogenase [Marinobacter nanhaiticus D15-8W]|uniref:UDP-N-acetylenolpyruvoylglucosamine reductase n=1 Tax=Marinobacter nanhaiticus D15-8W TaxID=626887 RepID=N6WRW8_9GAMM|nr:UDP-N-acetylmuramate dehydrogenase [Marinobacter nanhaiticus]ENO13757.1 UDP-N-acetylmuramate dehydrogenase [Marinobacter nanhaiticus D15-8W]BES71130.1 UDP-N-acetylmuramate dehydrogenase [Marinobacter nanhaiticus D15-8W]
MNSGVVEREADVSLQTCNTLRLPAKAAWLCRVKNIEELCEALDWADHRSLPTLILGGGSNVIVADDFPGLVIKVAFSGRCWSDVSAESATLELGAGENWHATVMYAVRAGYRGIENLALIPGTVGAAPIQNIGAYGVELSHTVVDVQVWDREAGDTRTLSADECEFGYRDSLFKRHPDRYVVLRVRLRLSRKTPLNLGYRDLQEFFEENADVGTLTPEDVARAVMQVRCRKLPDPDFLPNAGSFFKNPVVALGQYRTLKERFPELVAYESADSAKLAAGWLIDFCGWKGYRESHVGVHNRQALVLVHHGDGEGRELLSLAARIRDDVKGRFGVALEVEPRIFPVELRSEFGF